MANPLPVSLHVDPISLYAFFDAGGGASISIPPNPAVVGFSFAAQEAIGHSSLPLTNANLFTIQ